MQATAISSMNRSIKIIVVRALKIMLSLRIQAAVDSRKIKRCPAVSFAASRRPRAIGWAIRLMVSIHTIRGIRYQGVPWGTK